LRQFLRSSARRERATPDIAVLGALLLWRLLARAVGLLRFLCYLLGVEHDLQL